MNQLVDSVKEGEALVKIQFKGKTPIIEDLSEEYTIEYLARSPKGILYLVIWPKDPTKRKGFYETFRLFIGKGKNMKEAEILDAMRFRDGGTTYIKFRFEGRECTLHFPAGRLARANPNVTCDGNPTKAVKLELFIRSGFLLTKEPEGRSFIESFKEKVGFLKVFKM